MFCNACGSEISLAAEVCPSCGQPIAKATTRTLTHTGAARIASAAVASRSGSWARTAETVAPAVAPPAFAPSTASIFAGDLDVPGFPRDLPGRVALLTGLVMAADLLLPWVNVNGAGYAPTRAGLPALALLLALVAVVAPPLVPRWRRAPITHLLPFGVGAFLLGFTGALWVFAGPLAPMITMTLLARIINSGAPFEVNTAAGATLSASPILVAPAIGLYVFLIGACTLTVAGYLSVAARRER
jgi:hypothetical protein